MLPPFVPFHIEVKLFNKIWGLRLDPDASNLGYLCETDHEDIEYRLGLFYSSNGFWFAKLVIEPVSWEWSIEINPGHVDGASVEDVMRSLEEKFFEMRASLENPEVG